MQAPGLSRHLLTAETLRNADWPRESLDDIFYIPAELPVPEIVNAVTYLAREKKIDRIVALDEFDMEAAATLREHMRIPGMGLTTMRYFRDKLAMRMKALEGGIRVPDFIPVFNHHDIRYYLNHVPGPWVMKPRSEASAIGIRRSIPRKHCGQFWNRWATSNLPSCWRNSFREMSIISEEENMFRDAVREFAETEVRPHVQAMDEAAQFRADLIPKFFELGLMGIEVPEQFGGAGGSIFMAVLAIEELARVDASAAIYVDVHNTLVNNGFSAGAATSRSALLPAAHDRSAGRLRAVGAGQRQ